MLFFICIFTYQVTIDFFLPSFPLIGAVVCEPQTSPFTCRLWEWGHSGLFLLARGLVTLAYAEAAPGQRILHG